jgi:hypothetical protein
MSKAVSAALQTVTERCDTGDANYRLVLDVDPEGDVFDVHVRESADGNGSEQSCVVDNARKLRFPPPPNGHIPITLAPKELSDEPPAATAAPIRYFCPNDGRDAPCAEVDEQAWCDRGGAFLACCKKELVALGHDGMCGCPKGGSTHQGACEPSLHSTREYSSQYLGSAARRAIKPCGEAADAIGFELIIDPDGRVFSASIRGGATADERLQRCVLDGLRKLEVDPPPNGSYQVGYGPVWLKEKVH